MPNTTPAAPAAATLPPCVCGRPRGAGGRLPTCLVCLRAEVDRDRAERAARMQRSTKPTRQQAPATRCCRSCGISKPLADFAPQGRRRRRDCRRCLEARSA